MPVVTAGTVARLVAAVDGRDGAVLTDAGRRHLAMAVTTAALDRARPEPAAGAAMRDLWAALDLAEVPARGGEARRRRLVGRPSRSACGSRPESQDWDREPARLDRRAVRRPRHRHRGRRGTGARPREGRRGQRGPEGRPDQHLPARVRRRAATRQTPRAWRSSPPGPSSSPRGGTGRRTRRTPSTSTTTCPTTAWWTTPATGSKTDVRAVVASGPGGPEVLSLGDAAGPRARPRRGRDRRSPRQR